MVRPYDLLSMEYNSAQTTARGDDDPPQEGQLLLFDGLIQDDLQNLMGENGSTWQPIIEMIDSAGDPNCALAFRGTGTSDDYTAQGRNVTILQILKPIAMQ